MKRRFDDLNTRHASLQSEKARLARELYIVVTREQIEQIESRFELLMGEKNNLKLQLAGLLGESQNLILKLERSQEIHRAVINRVKTLEYSGELEYFEDYQKAIEE